MREVLLKRVRPLVERLAKDLVDVAVARVEAEIERMGEALDVALSAYANDASEPISAPAFGKPVLLSQARPDLVEKGQSIARELGLDFHSADLQVPAGWAALPLEKDIAATRDLVAMKKPFPADRDIKPANKSTEELREINPRQTVNGEPRKRGVMRCGRCGAVGFRADGCGTSHPTKPGLNSSAPASTLGNAVAKVDRMERIAARATTAPRARAVEEETDADEEDDEHRWSPQRIAEEKLRAESRKLGGELPIPSSSWEF